MIELSHSYWKTGMWSDLPYILDSHERKLYDDDKEEIDITNLICDDLIFHNSIHICIIIYVYIYS